MSGQHGSESHEPRMRTLLIRALATLEAVAAYIVGLWMAYFAMYLVLIRQGEVKGVSLVLSALACLGIVSALRRDPRRLLFWIGPFCVWYAAVAVALVGLGLMIRGGYVVPRVLWTTGVSAAIGIAGGYWLSRTSKYRDGAVDGSVSSSGPKPCD